MENSIPINLAREFADDTTSVSTALLRARKTAVNQFNKFLEQSQIAGGIKYDASTFPVGEVTESLLGKFSSYLRENVNKCETAHAYLSKMKNILEEDFKTKQLDLFRPPQTWFCSLRRVVSNHYLRKAEETNTAVTDSAPPLTEEVCTCEPM
jgi:Ca2+-dependent lipid-binding protein